MPQTVISTKDEYDNLIGGEKPIIILFSAVW